MPTSAEKRFIAFCIFLVVIVHLGLLSVEWRNTLKPSQSDFLALYAAGKQARGGGDRDNKISGRSGPMDPVLEFNGIPDRLHPPFEQLIFAPLSLFRYQAAFLVWYACNLLMLFSVPFLLWNHIPSLHRWFAYAVILSATFFPVFATVVKGQDSVLLLFLLTLCFLCLKSRREVLGGFVLALGMFKFTVVIPIAVGFAVMRKWRVLAGFVGTFLALLLVTGGLFGFGAFPAYWQLISNRGGGPVDAIGNESLMPNLRGFLHPLAAGAVSQTWVNSAVVLGSILIFAIISRRWTAEADDPSALDLLFSLQVVTAVIVSYHLYVHDDCVLLIPLLLSLNRLAGSNCRKSAGIPFALGASILYLTPFFAPLRVSMPLYFCASGLLLGGLYRSFHRTTALPVGEEQELSVMSR